MNGRSLKKIFGELKSERLTAAERGTMRLGLLQLVRKATPERQLQEESMRPKLSFLQLMTRRLTSMPAIIIAIIVALSGGVSVAAQNSLPGDALYPIKVEVNERVMTRLAFSVEASAEVEARLAERRVEEAEKLAASGKLKADVAAKLSERFDERAEKVNALIDRLEADGKTEAAANVTAMLESTLKVHNAILERLEAKATEAEKPVAEVRDKVEARAEKAAKARSRIEEKVRSEIEARPDIQAAAEGKMNAAASKIAEVKAFIGKVEAAAGAEATVEAAAKLATAESVFAEGEAKLEAGAYGEAFALFHKSMWLAQEAKVMAQINASVRAEVNDTEDSEDEEEGDVKSETKAEVRTEGSRGEAEVEFRLNVR